MIYHGGSSGRGLEDLADTVRETVEDLAAVTLRFDTIVVQGLSGALVGSPASIALEYPLVVVRKPDDGSYHGSEVIGRPEGDDTRFLFLDDFICDGLTYDRVMTECVRRWPASSLVGIYLYKYRRFEWLEPDGVIRKL